jgi:hypothetical protein
MLTMPNDGQLLYKMITVDNLLRSIADGYLHFNRVDSYSDFPGADPHDGQQPPKDQLGNVMVKFEKDTNFSAADYYDRSRTRTYACCFSLENSQYIWDNYANGCERGKICVVFNFGKLRARLNQTLQAGTSGLLYRGISCHQIFSINYGIVEHIDWDQHRGNVPHLPNPIKYTFMKDKNGFADDRELRVSLSALGIGQFALSDGTIMAFPTSLQMSFDFRAAMADATIREVKCCLPYCDQAFLQAELHKLHIVPGKTTR